MDAVQITPATANGSSRAVQPVSSCEVNQFVGVTTGDDRGDVGDR